VRARTDPPDPRDHLGLTSAAIDPSHEDQPSCTTLLHRSSSASVDPEGVSAYSGPS
jgi:hypothetical protein